MSGRWWRAYSRARHDPKLLKLTDKQFRWWFSIVCVASDNDGALPSHADLAVEFRVSGKVMTEALDALVAAGLLDHDEAGIHPHKWNVLQYKSDVSNERVKRFRERQCNVTGNVTVTPSESEADTEQNRAEQKEPERATRSGSRLPEDWQPSAEDRAFAGDFDIDVEATASVFRDYWHGVAGAKGRKADWAGTWRNWIRREVESRKQRPSVSTKPNGSNGSAPTRPDDASQWTARLRGYTAGGFWSGNWGPRPEDGGSHIPPTVLAAWRASA